MIEQPGRAAEELELALVQIKKASVELAFSFQAMSL